MPGPGQGHRRSASPFGASVDPDRLLERMSVRAALDRNHSGRNVVVPERVVFPGTGRVDVAGERACGGSGGSLDDPEQHRDRGCSGAGGGGPEKASPAGCRPKAGWLAVLNRTSRVRIAAARRAPALLVRHNGLNLSNARVLSHRRGEMLPNCSGCGSRRGARPAKLELATRDRCNAV